MTGAKLPERFTSQVFYAQRKVTLLSSNPVSSSVHQQGVLSVTHTQCMVPQAIVEACQKLRGHNRPSETTLKQRWRAGNRIYSDGLHCRAADTFFVQIYLSELHCSHHKECGVPASHCRALLPQMWSLICQPSHCTCDECEHVTQFSFPDTGKVQTLACFGHKLRSA